MKVEKNRIYRHFKGDYYIVIDTALNTTDDKTVVIYRELYGNGELFVREIGDFTAEVDRLKYPTATQKHRFELQEIESINPTYKKEG